MAARPGGGRAFLGDAARAARGTTLIRCFDASALAGRYVREAGTDDVTRWFREARPATSRLTWIEVASTAARRVRAATMTQAQSTRVGRAIQAETAAVLVVELTARCATLARRLVGRHALRASDAVHLASALDLRERTARDVEFVCFDDPISNAARAEGLRVLPER